MGSFLIVGMLAAQAAAQVNPQDLIDSQHFKRLRALPPRDPNAAETVYLNAAIQQLWGNLDEAGRSLRRNPSP